MEENEKNIDEETPENELSKEIDSILENIPKEDRHEVRKMIGMSMQMGGVISPQMELMKKMTPDHVTSFLEGQREATRFQFKENRENKIFMVLMLAIVLVFVIVIIHLLKDKPDIMEKVLYAAGGLVAGAVGGYGFGKSKKED